MPKSGLEEKYNKHLVTCAEWRGHVNALLEGLDKDQEALWTVVRKLDERIRAVEIRSAVYGFLAGIAATIIAFVITRYAAGG